MSGSSLGDLVFRKVWNHRTHRSWKSFNALQQIAILFIDELRAMVLLLFKAYPLQVLHRIPKALAIIVTSKCAKHYL